MAATTVTSNGTLDTGISIVDTVERQLVRIVVKLTVVNSEVITINHGEDEDLIRDVRVLVQSTGAAVAAADAAVVKTDADTTTITFGNNDAGDYTIVIEY